VLALAAERYGVEVHAYCVMSNHYHLVITDPEARLPEFQQFLDALVARALNSLLGRWEAFWGPDSYSAVALAGARDIVDKASYTLANPVAAGLVRSARRWPGPWSAPESVGVVDHPVPRPRHFFDPEGGMPDSVPLRLTTPPGFGTTEAFRELLLAGLAERELAAVKKVGSFLGVARVLAQRTTARPRDMEPRRRLNPRVASRDMWKRVEALGRLVTFLADYRAALRDWRAGRRSAVFPAGTYQMRVACGVVCSGAG
jgi:REP element-mobilizing transposase RayT